MSLSNASANGDLGGTMRLGAYPCQLGDDTQGAGDLWPVRNLGAAIVTATR